MRELPPFEFQCYGVASLELVIHPWFFLKRARLIEKQGKV